MNERSLPVLDQHQPPGTTGRRKVGTGKRVMLKMKLGEKGTTRKNMTEG